MIILKSILLTICAATLIAPSAFGAIASTTVWEVRSSATASNVNGGGYNPSNASAGTDYSQQDAAQFSGSNLASTNGTTAPCVVSSASHNFVSTDNGNLIHITAGTSWTAGWYEIVSTSGNAATLDRACGSAATLSSGTWNEGGAISLSASSDGTWAAVPTSGNTVWVRNGTYTTGAAMTFGNSTFPAVILLNGYNASRGDNPTGSSRPTIVMGANALTSGNFNHFNNLIVTGTGTTVLNISSHGYANNVKSVDSSTTAARSAVVMGASAAMFNCEAVSYNGNAINASTSNATVIGSYLHDSGSCLTSAATSTSIVFLSNIVDSCTAFGLSLTAAATSSVDISGNTFFGGATNRTGTAINSSTTGVDAVRIYNNIIYGFSTGVATADANNKTVFGDFNDFNNNGTDVSNYSKGTNDLALNPGFGNVGQYTGTTATTSGTTLTDSGANFANVVAGRDYIYVSSSTGGNTGVFGITGKTTTTITTDNSLGTGSSVNYQVTTGRNFAIGTALKFKGFPGVFPGSNTTGYLDTGAVQRHEYGRPVNK